jgi:hypothetical protein
MTDNGSAEEAPIPQTGIVLQVQCYPIAKQNKSWHVSGNKNSSQLLPPSRVPNTCPTRDTQYTRSASVECSATAVIVAFACTPWSNRPQFRPPSSER